jgi:hypothetical protein
VYRAPPLRFFAPSAVVGSANRLLSGSTRTPSLYDLSQVLEGLILAELCRLVSSCCRSWGSSPSELFPADQLCQVHHPVIPSQRFVPRSMIDGFALRGFRTSAIRHPIQEYCILHQAAALLGFHPLPRCPCFRARCVSRRIIRSWSSLRSRTGRARSRPSASSTRTAWHLSIARAPSVLAFSPFLRRSSRSSSF